MCEVLPDFQVRPSETIAAELLVTNTELMPDPAALTKLAADIGVQLPQDSVTALLLREGEYPIPNGILTMSLGPYERDAPPIIKTQHTALPEGAQRLDVTIRAVDEPSILIGFAKTLGRRKREAESQRAARIGGGLAVTGFAEAAVSYVGLHSEAWAQPGYAALAVGVGLFTFAYLDRTSPQQIELPNLEEHSSPVILTQRPETAQERS